MNHARLTFCGGTGSVTGANFLLEAAGLKILVDCGLVQGSRFAEEENRKPFPYDPGLIDYLLVTHAHIDHIGRIPRLVAAGFKGKIYSTPETRALAPLMFTDALRLMAEEAGESGTAPLYNEKDVSSALASWHDAPYHQALELAPEASVYPKDAGHILGSAMYEITFPAYSSARKIVFTGDLGNSPTPILRDTEKIVDADYLVMESVYGDRNHENREARRARLKDVITEAAARKGALVIPTFSLEKTQVLLYELHTLEESHEIPTLPVFLDSPLAIEVTKVYEKMRQDFNDKALAEEAHGDIFRFPRLKFTPRPDESKEILNTAAPKIILAGSGMSNGGRVLHHERNYLPGPENTLLLVGFQAAGTLGRQIQDGAKEVMIEGAHVPVRAHVETISGYSSHKDTDHLVEFVEHTAEKLKKVFVVMGEPKSSMFLAQRLRDYLGVEAVHPALGDGFILG